MSPIRLQKDECGNVELCPITDFQVQVATNDMVILTNNYVESIEQFDAGEWKQLQTIIPATRALDLGATLKKAAKLILQSDSFNSN
ncbi:MAG TPA: hypothetical protein VGF82_27325 [Terracidiphilus sp.]|jgi:hypothetical protein